jgi:hypothetical protein
VLLVFSEERAAKRVLEDRSSAVVGHEEDEAHTVRGGRSNMVEISWEEEERTGAKVDGVLCRVEERGGRSVAGCTLGRWKCRVRPQIEALAAL